MNVDKVASQSPPPAQTLQDAPLVNSKKRIRHVMENDDDNKDVTPKNDENKDANKDGNKEEAVSLSLPALAGTFDNLPCVVRAEFCEKVTFFIQTLNLKYFCQPFVFCMNMKIVHQVIRKKRKVVQQM